MLETLSVWNTESIITTTFFVILWVWLFIFRVWLSFPSLRGTYYFLRRPKKLRDIGYLEWKHYYKQAKEVNLYPSLLDRIYRWSKADRRRAELESRAKTDAEAAKTAYQ